MRELGKIMWENGSMCEIKVHKWMNKWANEGINKWTDEWISKWKNEKVSEGFHE